MASIYVMDENNPGATGNLSSGESSCVHVTVLFPQDIERRRYYLAEGTYLNVKTCNLVVDENDFHESIPVVEIDLTPTALNLSIPPREPPPAVSSWTRPFSRFR
jgi:hypothetical protein